MAVENDILKDFLSECKENLELLDQQFVELEQNPEDAELIKSIFRTIHTIKGTSGFFGFTTLEGIAHFGEDILSKLRDGTIRNNEDITTMLLKAVDHIKAIISVLEQTGKEPDDLAYLDFIVELRNFAEKITKNKPSRQEDTQAPLSSPGPADNTQRETPKDDASSGGSSDTSVDISVSQPSTPPVTGASSAEASLTKEPVAASLDPGDNKRVAPATASAVTAQTQHLTETHVRVDVQLLDNLMNLAGELVLSRNRLTQLANQINNIDLLTASQHMSLIVTEMQTQIMKTRMQPIGNVFNKFPRIVRDLAKTAQKQVQLRIEGAETELDRSIIESIKDPLTHMVRNSIDHGIEHPDIRIQKGKPAMGTLIMRAYHEGGQVIIEIQDDGAGIDPKKIRSKAVEKGILKPEDANNLSDRDVLMLIFQPGFSTAEKVTNISGRGVGMDVVKTNIEKLGGVVDLQSEPGVGTTVKIKIPLTLAIIPALIVQTGGERYAIPQVNLVELVHLQPDVVARDVQLIGNAEFYRLRGEILPLVRLRDILGLGTDKDSQAPDEGLENKPEEKGDTLNIVVLNSGERQFGLVVDSINDSEEIVVKPLGDHLKHIPCYAGTTLMGDGRAALILDVVGIASTLNLRAEETLKQTKFVTESEIREEDQQFLLFFTVDPNEFFAIPLSLVNRLDKINANQIERVSGREVVQYRKKSMPVIRLENYLPISPLPEQDEYYLIVFNMNNKDIAFLVSKIEDSLNIAIDVDEENFRQDGILGSAIVRDRTTLFLDVYQIINIYNPDFFVRYGQNDVFSNSRILLAEDSSFYRNLLSSYLSAAGFNVTMSEDGQDAWEKLQQEAFDVVITDIEMPRMNGLELTRKIREDARLKGLPVIVVTSLSGEEGRRRAIQVGVDAYHAKLERDMVLKSVESLLSAKKNQNQLQQAA
ncbi:MAG: hybrid sensor histidine kinase/response regulator [Dissulfurimicrobium sp.]|uniref:hybrid sensor histidine kinase/response regulator n=1 Tax=Dissulfurimicrobium sp. TaxID=2022436 RepID=UPI00404A2CF1